MKLEDLILEVRVFQNNFIKVDMVTDELKKIFKNEKVPQVKFDEDGMFILVDNFIYRNFLQEGVFNTFSLVDAGIVDEIKNIKKYYIEFIKKEVKDDTTMKDNEEQSDIQDENTGDEVPVSD